MQTIDFNGKTLSNAFNSATTAPSQFVKPKVTIVLRDGRHLSNVVVTTNNDHTINTAGSIGYYFDKTQVVSGAEYESFPWAVAGDLDSRGRVITANGKFYAMPSDLSGDFKYGWRSKDKNINWAAYPTLDISFDATVANKIKIVTSNELGKVNAFNIDVYRSGNVNVLTKSLSFDNNGFEKIVNLDSTYTDITRVVVTIVSNKNTPDYSRIMSVSPIYELDISDYVVSISDNRIRDLHETSLPIAGSSQSSCDLVIDNTDKKFNILNTNSEYGKYLEKDLKVNVCYGWKSYESEGLTVESFLTANLASSGASYIYLNNATEFPSGDISNTGLESNYYIVTIDKDKFSEEKILVKKKIDNVSLEIAERGFGDTDSVSHSQNATITFDPFEYVEIGTYFIEDISSSSADMTVNLQLGDRFKFLNDKVIEKGFFKENTTVGDALKELLYFANFPNNKFIKYDRFQDSAVLNDAILHLKFNDENKNTGSPIYVGEGLRFRVYQPPDGFESTVKDLQLDINEKELSDLDKALGLASSVTPSFVGFKSNVYLSGYTLSSDDALLNDKNYQGVFDGYYVPIYTVVDEEIGIEIDEGGARLYIDDNLVIDAWNENTVLTYASGVASFTSGVPYKIRLEFYHSGNNDLFDLNLTIGAGRTVIESNELITNIVLDHIGSKTNINSFNKRNNAIATPSVVFQQLPSISWDLTDKSVELEPVANSTTVDSFIRLPYNSSWDITDDSINPYRNWSIEHIVSFANVGGEYISSWSNANSTAGIEFFHSNSTSHGVKLKTLNSSNNAVGTATITSTTILPDPNGWNHFITTYDNDSKVLTYYVDGVKHGNTTLAANIYPEFGTNHLTFGGRGSSFTSPTNLLTNPDFDIDTSSWTATGGATISINTSTPYAGSGSLTITSSATNYNGVTTDFITISPNTSYYLSAMCRNLSGNTRTVYIGVQWFNSSNTFISEINSAAQGTLSTAAGWVQRFATGTSPATAVKAKVFLLSGTTGLSAGWTTGFDNVLFEQSSTLRPFNPYTYGGVVKPTNTLSSNGVNMNIDEFIIYPRALSSSEVLKRYRETQIKEVKKFPFLYGINQSIYQTIQDISFAELGRVFIDEKDFIKYDHYHAFFENSIDQHANVQKEIADTTFISEASIDKNLQVNSVIVKVSGIASNTTQTQPIWRAPDNTTLGVITLTSAVSNSNAVTSIPCSGFDFVPFSNAGYIIIDNEIIKYNNKDKLNFLSIERGALGTTIASHNANALIREVRYFNFEYDKSPSLNVKNPFITGILFEDPDEINILHWSASPFKGNLIISASENIESDSIVFAEGTNPITEKVAFTSIAGIPIEVSENKSQIIEQKAINSENRRKYGLKEVVIDSPYITDTLQAQALADFIIEKLSEPIPIIEVRTVLIPTLQVGDRIRITSFDQFDIINGDYWIVSISTSVGSDYSQSMTLRKVV